MSARPRSKISNIAAGKRNARLRDRERKQMEKLSTDLIGTLSKYLALHMGDPSSGRTGALLNGPVIARLAAASSLRALLMEVRQRGLSRVVGGAGGPA